MNIEITKDMIPIAKDFIPRDKAVEKTKFALQKQFEKKMLKTVNDINIGIEEGMIKGKAGLVTLVDNEIGDLLVEPLKQAGYKVYTEKLLDQNIRYTIEWIYDKKVGDE